MRRSAGWRLGVGLVLSASAACALLEPYPGGGDPAEALQKDGAGPTGGTPQDPLIDPPTDTSVSVVSEISCPDDTDKGCVLALPGTGFPVHLSFVAQAGNVVGGGIRIEGSNEVQWTLLADVMGEVSGELRFSYVLPEDVCNDVPNLCHVIDTEQFAVTSDGSGGFAVSEPVAVRVVLQCAPCTSQSCIDALPAGTCQECTQPEVCKMLGETCFSPGAPGDGTESQDIYDAFLDEDGILWTSEAGCAQGAPLCQQALDNFQTNMQCTF